MDALPAAIITAVGGLLGALLGFHLGRPKQKAEVTDTIASAAKTTTDTALELVQELKERMDEQDRRHSIEMAKLHEENRMLKEQIRQLENLPAKVAFLERENTELRAKNAELEKLVRSQRGLGMKS